MAITITTGKPLFQRHKTTGLGTATVAGSYDGSPTSIVISIRKVADDSEVATASNSSPSGGTYSVDVAGIPESILANASGDLYYAHATSVGVGDTASSKGVWEFHVGRWVCVFGQSNALFMFSTQASPPSAATGTYYHTSSFAAVPSANGVRELLNGLVDRFGVPWGCVQYSVAAVNLDFFEIGQPGYATLQSRISAVGDIECAICVHGESAAVDSGSARNSRPANYASLLNDIHEDLAAIIGRETSQCPLFVQGLGRETTTYSNYSWHRAMQCCWYAARKYADIHLSHSAIDVPLSDSIHYTAAGYAALGKRFALAIANYYGLEPASALWGITGVEVVSSTKTRVSLSSSLGGDFNVSVGDITGFEVSSNGIGWVSAAGSKIDSGTIELTHASMPYPNRAVRFCYGRNPDVSNIPLETELGSPLFPTMIWATNTSSLTGNPILQFSTSGTPSGNGNTASGTLERVGLSVSASQFVVHSIIDTSTTLNNFALNGSTMTLIATASSGVLRSRLHIATTASEEQVISVEYATPPFRGTIVTAYMVLCGQIPSSTLLAGRATAATSLGIDVNVKRSDLILAIYNASFGAGVTGFSDDDANAYFTFDASRIAVASVDNIANTITGTSTNAVDLILGVLVFDAPTPGVWDTLSATGSRLTITNAQSSDATDYRCTVTDASSSSVTSDLATLTVT